MAGVLNAVARHQRSDRVGGGTGATAAVSELERCAAARGKYHTVRDPAGSELRRADTEAAAARIDTQPPVAIAGRCDHQLGIDHLPAADAQPVHGGHRDSPPWIVAARTRKNLDRRDAIRLRQGQTQTVHRELPSEVEGVFTRRFCAPHHLLPVPRQIDQRFARLARETGQWQRLRYSRPGQAEVPGLARREFNAQLLESLTTLFELQHRRIRHQRRPPRQVITDVHPHARGDAVRTWRQFQQQRLQRQLDRRRIDQVAEQRRVACRRPTALVDGQHGPARGAFNTDIQPFDTGNRIAAQSEERQP